MRKWLKLHSSEWLTGSIRGDLTMDERSIWADLLALANMARDGREGFIERGQGLEWPEANLAAFLDVPAAVLHSTITKCMAEGRITRLKNGVLQITNWNKYQAVPDYASKAKAAKENNKTMRDTFKAIIQGTTRAVNETNFRLKNIEHIATNKRSRRPKVTAPPMLPPEKP